MLELEAKNNIKEKMKVKSWILKKMIIGLDIDNVISNFDDELLKEFLEHDKELRNTGIINENAEYVNKGMFDWSQEEADEFYYNNIERIAKSLKTIENASETIEKLHKQGNTIIIISGRDNGEYKDPKELTENWLKQHNIVYDKLILTDTNSKGLICKKNNIDIMVEDDPINCKDISSKGVKVFMMATKYNKNYTEFERVSNWKEIYKKIEKMVIIE